MIALTVEQVADVVGGDLMDGAHATATVSSVTIDSRTAGPGALFVALRGEHTDGHEFLADAAGRGAAGFLVEADRVGDDPPPGSVVVDDPADALLGLGAHVRREVDPAVVAVTGSSGKTTTKDLLRAAIGAGRRVVANVGSYNNELGVPLTCCRLDRDSEALVAEVGARGQGHVAKMADILEPDVAVVTNVGAAHLEMFGDLDGVARAKSELVAALGPEGVAVLNADDPRVAGMAAVARGRVVTYGLGEGADLRATRVELDELARPSFDVDGVRVSVPLPGMHNVGNALAALAGAEALGVSREAAAGALAGAAVSQWRMQIQATPEGARILNDAYNANPSSLEAALRTLVAAGGQGRRWAVLGHMAELGPGGDAEHERLGRLAADLGVDVVVVVGPLAAPLADGAESAGGTTRVIRVEEPAAAVDAVRSELTVDDIVLVKASRSVGLERVATGLATGAAT